MKKKPLSLNNFEEILCAAAMSITILAIVVNIALGWFTGRRFGQLEEVSISAFVWVTFMGVSVAYKHRAHICIDFVVSALPERIQRGIDILIYLILTVFGIYLIGVSWQLAMGAIGKTTSLLGIPYFYIDLSVVLGFGCMTVRVLIDLVRSVRGLMGKGE